MCFANNKINITDASIIIRLNEIFPKAYLLITTYILIIVNYILKEEGFIIYLKTKSRHMT